MEKTYYTVMKSPVCDILLAASDDGLCCLGFQESRSARDPDPSWVASKTPFKEVVAQLKEYFAGQRTRFDLPLDLRGTPFQRSVWKALLEIPYGETASYGDIAGRIGNPKACRAVGGANGANPVAVIVPCHRVIGSNGKLTGFGAGLPIKRRLLDLEGVRSRR